MLSALLLAWTPYAWTSGQETPQEETVLRATLPNGLRVVIVPNTLTPVATVVVNYGVGSNHAPDNFPGTAHALEHMMFRGSPGLSGEQLANVTAAIGGSFNADTQQTVTQYFFTVPVKDLDVVLHIESLRMRGILADEKSWGQERGAIEQEVAKRQEITAAELEKNSMHGLALAWSQAVAVEGRRSPEEKLKAIRRVSTDDVRTVARTYLDPRQAVVAVLTPQASGEAVSSGAFRQAESLALKEAATVKIPPWAQKSWQRLEIPVSNVHPALFTLPNGLNLIVQPEKASRTVEVYGHIRNHPDMTQPRGQEGVDAVLEALFSYGTTSLERLAFQKALDDIGAVESAGSDFSLQVLSDHF
ncbi:MAG: insulinase family protein, partial [Desulfobacterales bacterium]